MAKVNKAFLGDVISEGSKAAAEKLKSGAAKAKLIFDKKSIGSAGKKAFATVSSERTLITASGALFIADVFTDEEPLEDDDVGQFLSYAIDAGWIAVTLLSIHPYFRLFSTAVSAIRKVAYVGTAVKGARATFLKAMPFVKVVNRDLFGKFAKVSRPVRGFTTTRVVRDVKKGTAQIINKAGEAIIEISKSGVTLSPLLASAFSKRGLALTGGTALGLTLFLDDDEGNDNYDEVVLAIKEWADMLITLSGYVDDADEVEYLVDERVTGRINNDSFFEIMNDYSYYAERHAATTRQSEAAFGDDLMIEIANRLAPLIKMINEEY